MSAVTGLAFAVYAMISPAFAQELTDIGIGPAIGWALLAVVLTLAGGVCWVLDDNRGRKLFNIYSLLCWVPLALGFFGRDNPQWVFYAILSVFVAWAAVIRKSD